MSAAGESASLGGALRDFLRYPLPRGVGWAHVSGSLLLTLFGVQALTGALLALYYSPSAAEAWDSVRYIEEHVIAGAFVRGMHHWAAMLFVPLAALHLAHVFWSAAYKAPRRATWLVGCLLFACLLGFGFTGYLLPWDLKALFGTRVGVEIAGSVPIAGDYLRRLLAGGEAVGALTLPRFYALHAVILPPIFLSLVALHLVLVRMHGIAPHADAAPGELSGELFHPHQTLRDGVAALLLVLVVGAIAYQVGAPLEERADASNTSYVPRPEWYFLGAQQLLRLFQGDKEILASTIIPGLSMLLLFAWPWLDRTRTRSPKKRPFALLVGLLAGSSVVVLTVWGALEIRREEEQMALRVAAQEREAAALAEPVVGAPTETPADDAQLLRLGSRLHRELACDACHGEDAESRMYGTPGLELHGDRSGVDWTAAYLLDPTRIRYGESGELPALRMPDYLLEEDEARALALNLAAMRDEERVPAYELALEPLSIDEARQAETLYLDWGCADCHLAGGEGEPVGPDLDAIYERRSLAYVRAIMVDPELVVPDTSMDTYGIAEEEVELLLRYMSSF